MIKRTYGYVLTTGALAAIYGLLVLISNLFFGRYEITRSRMFPLVFILAVVFFQPRTRQGPEAHCPVVLQA